MGTQTLHLLCGLFRELLLTKSISCMDRINFMSSCMILVHIIMFIYRLMHLTHHIMINDTINVFYQIEHKQNSLFFLIMFGCIDTHQIYLNLSKIYLHQYNFCTRVLYIAPCAYFRLSFNNNFTLHCIPLLSLS